MLADILTSCVEAGGLQSPRLECAELTVQFINGLGSQYEPGDMAAESLQFHVEQPADMLTTYKFAVDICVGQWNEEVDGAACFAASP